MWGGTACDSFQSGHSPHLLWHLVPLFSVLDPQSWGHPAGQTMGDNRLDHWKSSHSSPPLSPPTGPSGSQGVGVGVGGTGLGALAPGVHSASAPGRLQLICLMASLPPRPLLLLPLSSVSLSPFSSLHVCPCALSLFCVSPISPSYLCLLFLLPLCVLLPTSLPSPFPISVSLHSQKSQV